MESFIAGPEIAKSHLVEGVLDVAHILVRGFTFLIFSVLKKGLVNENDTYLKLSSNIRPISQ